MKSGGWLVNQCLTLSLSDNGNNCSLRASSVTPLYLIVSHISMKLSNACSGSHLPARETGCFEASEVSLFSTRSC